MSVIESTKAFLSKVGWKIGQKAPEICLFTGITAAIGSVVCACRATVKAIPAVNEAKKQLENVEKCLADGVTAKGEEYTKADKKKDVRTIRTQLGVKILLLSLPTVACLAVTTGSQIGVYKTLSRRVALLSAAVAAYASKLKSVLNYISDKYGEDAERDAFYGAKEIEMHEDTGEVDENGEPIKNTYTVKVADDDDYTLLFDHTNPHWEPDFEMNLSWLRQKQAHWNRILKLRDGKPVWLNEIRKDMDSDTTQLGQIAGWRYDPNNPDGDNIIDFGLTKVYTAYRNGEEFPDECGIMLEFNVDGNVLTCVK